MSYDKLDTASFYDSIYDKRNYKKWYRVNRYYAMNFDFFEMEPHSHREFEIMYVASGCCRVLFWTKEEQPEELYLKKGEYAFLDGGTKHQLVVEKGIPCRILNMEIQIIPSNGILMIQDFIKKSKSFQSFLAYHLPIFKGYDATGNLHTIITELHRQLHSSTDKEEGEVMQNLILAQFLIEISRQRARKYSGKSGNLYIRKALTYLLANYDQDIKIKDIASSIEISSAYLQRLFKEETGKTLIEKINELRIEKAKVLLETSSLPIVDIASSVGYHNRQHFTHTFLKLVGCSPGVFRQHKGDRCFWQM